MDVFSLDYMLFPIHYRYLNFHQVLPILMNCTSCHWLLVIVHNPGGAVRKSSEDRDSDEEEKTTMGENSGSDSDSVESEEEDDEDDELSVMSVARIFCYLGINIYHGVRSIYILNSLHNSHPQSLGKTISMFFEKKAAASGELDFLENRVVTSTPQVRILSSLMWDVA